MVSCSDKWPKEMREQEKDRDTVEEGPPGLVDARTARLFPGGAPAASTGRSLQNGVLPSQDIWRLIREDHVIAKEPIGEKQVQPASLDLRLGAEVYRLQASFLPGKATVEQKLESLSMVRLKLTDSTVLERGCVYLVPLMETLDLPCDVSAKANPKSSTGRLDVFTRLITDGGSEFEVVPKGYAGPLFAEIMPRTFPVIVRPKLSLSQIRFIRGRPQLTGPQTRDLNKKEKLIRDETNPIGANVRDDGMEISVSLRSSDDRGIVAYKGKHNTPLIDLKKIGFYEVERFWDEIPGRADGRLILNPGEFYILASRERISVPPNHAAEMVPFDPSVGEFRIHYAGFFDPGFGCGDSDVLGTRAVLEVRAHEIPFVIEHGQVVGRLVYSRMLNVPEKIYGKSIGSSYQRQDLALSKQFRRSVSSARAPA